MAYEHALEERTQGLVPVQWAATQNNPGTVELAFFVKNELSKHFDTAQGHADAAHALFKAAGASHYLAIADRRLEKIATHRAAIT